jgi:hypothetical protein
MIAVCALMVGACRGANDTPPPVDPQAIHRDLFAEIQPVKLSNCEFERIGDKHDGGYVTCKNLVPQSKAIYSYGISASDQWGCTLSARLGLPVHQYDCFNTTPPPCPGATPQFHAECVGPAKLVEDGRPFDTVEAQIAKNGDTGKRTIMKMDVEGAEWPSFMATPDALLSQIDQLSVEFHGVEDPRFVQTIRKLKKTFHVVNVHYNNWTCHPDVAPLPALAFEVLFVNKSIGVVEPNGVAQLPNPFDAPNNWERPDCQAAPPATESKSQNIWVRLPKTGCRSVAARELSLVNRTSKPAPRRGFMNHLAPPPKLRAAFQVSGTRWASAVPNASELLATMLRPSPALK